MAEAHTFPRLLKRPEVEQLLGLSTSSLYRLMASGDLPGPIRVGARAVRWKASDLAEWLDSRPST